MAAPSSSPGNSLPQSRSAGMVLLFVQGRMWHLDVRVFLHITGPCCFSSTLFAAAVDPWKLPCAKALPRAAKKSKADSRLQCGARTNLQGASGVVEGLAPVSLGHCLMGYYCSTAKIPAKQQRVVPVAEWDSVWILYGIAWKNQVKSGFLVLEASSNPRFQEDSVMACGEGSR